MARFTTRGSLLARLANDPDELAWQEFHRQYARMITRVAERRGLQPADCEDVVQDVLVRLAGAMPNFEYDRTRGKFRSYVKTVVLHTIADRFRQKRPATPVEDIEAAAARPSSARTSPGWPEADQVWEEEWQTYHVNRAMKTIEVEFGERDRLAFAQSAQLGRPAAEVAAGLGVSVDQVYQAKSRILRRLAELVAAQIEEEE